MSEAELLECLYRVGDGKYQGKGWRSVLCRTAYSDTSGGGSLAAKNDKNCGLYLTIFLYRSRPDSSEIGSVTQCPRGS